MGRWVGERQGRERGKGGRRVDGQMADGQV